MCITSTKFSDVCCGKTYKKRNPAWVDPVDTDTLAGDLRYATYEHEREGIRLHAQNEYAVAGIDICLAIEETATEKKNTGGAGEGSCEGQVECCFDLWPGGSDNDCCEVTTTKKFRLSCSCLKIEGGLLEQLLQLLPWVTKDLTTVKISWVDMLLGFLQGRGLGGSKQLARIKKGGLDQLKGWLGKLLNAIGAGLFGASLAGLNPFNVKSISLGCDKGCPWTLGGLMLGRGNCDMKGKWVTTSVTKKCICCGDRLWVASDIWPDGSAYDPDDPMKGRSDNTTFETRS